MPMGRKCDVCGGWLDGDVIRDAEHLFSEPHEKALRAADNWREQHGQPRMFATHRIDYAKVRAEIAARKRNVR